MNPLEQQMMLNGGDMPDQFGQYPKRRVQEMQADVPAPIQQAMAQPAPLGASQQPSNWTPLDPVGQQAPPPMAQAMAPQAPRESPFSAAMLMQMGGAMMSEKNGVQGIGKALSVGGQHLDYQQTVKAAREKADEDRALRRDQLEDKKALSRAKVANLASKTAMLGAPKIVDNGNGMMTAIYTNPNTGEVSYEYLTNDEAKAHDLLKEQGKNTRAEQMLQIKKDAATNKPLPATVQREINELNSQIGSASKIINEADTVIEMLDKGDLDISLPNKVMTKIKGWAGMADDGEANFAIYQMKTKAIANESLLLHKGVQTEGDAQRAMDMLNMYPNDPKIVSAAMREFKRINAIELDRRKQMVSTLQENNGGQAATFDPKTNAQLPNAPKEAPQAPAVALQGPSPSQRATAKQENSASLNPEKKTIKYQGKSYEGRYFAGGPGKPAGYYVEVSPGKFALSK